jgi:uncharacterized membrane protein
MRDKGRDVMTLLLLGLVAFAVLHMIPFWGQNVRTGAIKIIGAMPYKGLFALATLGSFVLMVMGWKAAEIGFIYEPPTWGRHVTPLFVLAGFVLFIASNAPTNIRRMVRHPQLMGVTLWGIGHLLSNGENRSVLLFAGMAIFSLVAMMASNKRDGDWVKRDKVSLPKDIITVVIALALFGGFMHFHEAIIGVAPFG